MKIAFRPRFDKCIAGWATTHAKKNVWKFNGDLDISDLLQEAWVIFEHCRNKSEFENAKHFMAYFKVAYSRTVLNLVKKHTRRTVLGAGVHIPNLELIETSDATLETARLFSRMPEEVRKVVQALLESPNGEMLHDVTGRESTNEYLTRISGLRFANHRKAVTESILALGLK